MVPSVYEDGTLYNVLPSGNKAPDETGNHNGYDQTRADFTFSRGSNLAATRVNANGLIEKGRENLLTYSNDFSNSAWSKTSGSSVASGYSGYDGTNNAFLFTDSGTNSSYGFYQQFSFSGVLTFSIYLKAGSDDTIGIDIFSSAKVARANINLTSGTITGSNDIDVSISDVSNGWYRCSVTGNLTSAIYARIGTGSAGGTFYGMNAQLEYGLAASSYLDSGATTATAGVLENTPRIDYSSGAGALLLEPQRTNNILNSEYFGGYSFTNGSITTNNTTSPEGLNNASTFAESTATGTHQMRITTGVTSGSDVTFSFYAKANGRDYVNFWEDVTTGHQAYFNLSTGVATNNGFTSVGIEDAGNGWYRCYGTKSSFGGSSFGSRIHASQDANFNSYTGDGTSGFHIYGLQLESSASYPSSYVPTYGSAATRGADLCENATASTNIFGASKGAFYIEGYVNTLDTNGIIPFTAGTGTSALMYVWIRTNGTLYVEWYESGVLQAQLNTTSGAVNVGDSFKIAAAYQNNDFVAYLNGTLIETDTNGTAPNPTSLKLGQYTSGAYKGGALSKVYVFNERLSNTELAALTA